MSSRTILLIHTYNSYYSIWKYVIGGDVVLFAFWRQSVCVGVCVLSVWPTFWLLSHSEEERIGMHAQYKRFPLRFLYLVVYFTCSLSHALHFWNKLNEIV